MSKVPNFKRNDPHCYTKVGKFYHAPVLETDTWCKFPPETWPAAWLPEEYPFGYLIVIPDYDKRHKEILKVEGSIVRMKCRKGAKALLLQVIPKSYPKEYQISLKHFIGNWEIEGLNIYNLNKGR